MALAAGLAIAIVSLILGAQGFTAAGIPFTSTKRIKGRAGIVVGVICLAFGLLALAATVYPFIHIARSSGR